MKPSRRRAPALASSRHLSTSPAVTLTIVPVMPAAPAVMGVSLVESASLTLLIAIFASNLPEALVGAVAMRQEERNAKAVMGVWLACAALLTVAIVVGRAVAGVLSDGGGLLPLIRARRVTGPACKILPSAPVGHWQSELIA